MNPRWEVRMIEVLVIADDLTGALDAAAPFIGAGAEVRTAAPDDLRFEELDTCVRVLSVNAATRHLDASEARECIASLVRSAVAAGVPYIVKKTDSVLRGNVGAELEGALAAHPSAHLEFYPSLPSMGRVTVGGVHCVDGVPVAQSAFADDPFEPVVCSRVDDIIALQSDVAVVSAACAHAVADRKAVVVHDAATDEELAGSVRGAVAGGAALFAGCSGVVSALAEALGVPAAPQVARDARAPVLAFCGSVNPVSVGQCACAREQGVPTFDVAAASVLDVRWTESAAFAELARGLRSALGSSSLVVVDASVRATEAELAAAGVAPGEQARALTAANLGAMAAKLATSTRVPTLLVMGGDVLLALLEGAGCACVRMEAQIAPGVVVSFVELEGMPLHIVSKSGGFGDRDLFTHVAELLNK